MEWARRRRVERDARRLEAAGARALTRLDRLGPAWHIVDWPRTDAQGYYEPDPADDRAGFLAIGPGGVYAVTVADAMIRTGAARHALVIGAEVFSRILDFKDRTTCVLFGDGAGALVLEAAEGEGTIADRGVLTAHLRSDGSHKDKLYVDGGPSSTGTVGHLRMEGRKY